MGPWKNYKVIANSSSSNYVADTDGTMTALSVEWMAEDLNAGLQFPLGPSGPTPAHRGSHNRDKWLRIWTCHWHSLLHILLHQNSLIYSFIQLSCAECDNSLPFSGVSALFHQLVFHSPSLHLAIYFLVYLSALSLPNSYIIMLQNTNIIFNLV